MNFLPASVFGVRVIYSPLALQKTNEPRRVYKRRKWQSERKAALVQKKWTKRWGLVEVPAIYKTPGGFLAHPSFKAQLEQALAREQIIRERGRGPLSPAYL